MSDDDTTNPSNPDEYFKGYKITLEFVETEEDREFREIRTHNIKKIISEVYRKG